MRARAATGRARRDGRQGVGAGRRFMHPAAAAVLSLRRRPPRAGRRGPRARRARPPLIGGAPRPRDIRCPRRSPPRCGGAVSRRPVAMGAAPSLHAEVPTYQSIGLNLFGISANESHTSTSICFWFVPVHGSAQARPKPRLVYHEVESSNWTTLCLECLELDWCHKALGETGFREFQIVSDVGERTRSIPAA